MRMNHIRMSQVGEALGAVFILFVLVAVIAFGVYSQIEAQENPEEYCRSPYARNDLRCVGAFGNIRR